MRPGQRHEEIVRLVQKAGEVPVEDLAERLGVSRETIRRDLAWLDAAGRVRKFHGGARAQSARAAGLAAEGPFASRLADRPRAKRRIAARAAALLAPGDSLFIDTGTTTLMFAESLVGLSNLVVITNSWRIAATVSANASHKVFLIGGAYGADAGETLGRFAVDQIRRFRAGHAFLTIGAANEAAVMDFDAQETEIAQAMIERVERVTVLADTAKFARGGVFDVAPWTAIDRLVTDGEPPLAIGEAMAAAGVEIIDAG
ncbi:DeoR/GlpR family DNA-binding transcription regulator [Aureimonas populi]|uniref:DeoR/GlpR family DNA-binding transcription regulator n=1 Tax=Aureimonas populi TaxID=1701758 RepID=A0ABW5CI75_9HYPH|nr:DeoR/GlpR family DNA-binding transcription regulator [Aureimonas populi]